mgnify:CR=1 FL=1
MEESSGKTFCVYSVDEGVGIFLLNDADNWNILVFADDGIDDESLLVFVRAFRFDDGGSVVTFRMDDFTHQFRMFGDD